MPRTRLAIALPSIAFHSKLANAAYVIAIAVMATIAASPALAAVRLSDAPAQRAASVSGVAPVLMQPSDMTLGAGETADQELHATDSDGDALVFLKTSGPAYMTVSTTDHGAGIATGNVHLAPGLSDAGVVTATVAASDGVLTSSRSFSISVQPTPVAPVLTQPADMTVNAGGTQTQTLYASDANGDPLGFNLVSGPSYVTVTTTDPGAGSALGELVVAPGHSFSGTATATVGVSDGSLNDQKMLTVTVTPVNVAPVLTQPTDMIVFPNEVKDQMLTADDANGEPLTFSMVSGPAYMTVTTVDAPARIGNIHLAPGSGDVGAATGVVRVTDGLLADQKSVTITVSGLQWRVVAPFFDPRTSSGVAAAVGNIIGGKIYVSHGYPGYYLLSIYDIATNTWTHGGPTAPNSQFYGSNQASGGRALGKHYAMGGGGEGFGGSGHVEEFNPVTSSWRTVAAILIPPRVDFGAASWEDKIYAIGGYDLSISRVSDRNDVYDPATDSWRSLAPLPMPASGNFATVAYQGKIYVFGGSDRGFGVASFVQIYDIESNTWSAGPPMPTARAYAMAGVIGRKIAVFGGDAGGDYSLAVTEIYDPATNTWTAGPQMPTPAAQMARGVMYDDSGIYCIGSGHFQSDLTGMDVMVLRDVSVSALAVAVNIDPNVINLKSRASWVTAYIEPSGFDPRSIDLSSLRLAGSVPAAGSKSVVIGDHNANGAPDLVVKFSRETLDPLLALGMNQLEVTGALLTGEQFKGSDQVEVINPPGAHPTAAVAPNPLNPVGVLTFSTTRPGPVSIKMFDLQGRLVRTLVEARPFAAGSHEVRIDGLGEARRPLSSGVYFYRVEAPDGNVMGRLAILK